MAVFNQNRMLGYLSADETRGLAWILSQNPNMLISVPHPENSTKSVAIEIMPVLNCVIGLLVIGIASITLMT